MNDRTERRDLQIRLKCGTRLTVEDSNLMAQRVSAATRSRSELRPNAFPIRCSRVSGYTNTRFTQPSDLRKCGI